MPNMASHNSYLVPFGPENGARENLQAHTEVLVGLNPRLGPFGGHDFSPLYAIAAVHSSSGNFKTPGAPLPNEIGFHSPRRHFPPLSPASSYGGGGEYGEGTAGPAS